MKKIYVGYELKNYNWAVDIKFRKYIEDSFDNVNTINDSQFCDGLVEIYGDLEVSVEVLKYDLMLFCAKNNFQMNWLSVEISDGCNEFDISPFSLNEIEMDDVYEVCI